MLLDALARNFNLAIFRYEHVISYLASREVSKEDINKYGIGYNKVVGIPADPDPVRGEFIEATNNGKRFENKIIFPYKDTLGQVVGFLGRSLEKEYKNFVTEEAKYSGFFFGLYEALPYIYQIGYVFIVEGCFDCIALSKVFPNTVASMTAGLSEAQYALLRLYCKKLITVFDSDETGRFAANKVQEILNSDQKSIIDVNLVDYKDPAKCLEVLKLEKFRKYIMNKFPVGL